MRCQRCGCLNAEHDELCFHCGASLEVRTAAAPAGAAASVLYGGFWRRFWACMLDGIVLGFVSMLVYGAGLGIVGYIAPEIEDPAKALLIPQLVANTILKAFYFIYFHALSGQTVGKLALGLKVVGRDGGAIGFALATVRYFGSFISLLCAGLGFVWIAFDSRRQGWHDKMAGSFVVRV
ncbi:MAG: RDD family protein [Deltaproteobacteria bacterium]|nr:RDD family protein [Deltaproteobacteria bacterium]